VAFRSAALAALRVAFRSAALAALRVAFRSAALAAARVACGCDDRRSNGSVSWRGSTAFAVATLPRPPRRSFAFGLLVPTTVRERPVLGVVARFCLAATDARFALFGCFVLVDAVVRRDLSEVFEELADLVAAALGRDAVLGFLVRLFVTVAGLAFAREDLAPLAFRFDGFAFAIAGAGAWRRSTRVTLEAVFERFGFDAVAAALDEVRRLERVREVMVYWQQPARWEAMFG
jgi:hypothetical protein